RKMLISLRRASSAPVAIDPACDKSPTLADGMKYPHCLLRFRAHANHYTTSANRFPDLFTDGVMLRDIPFETTDAVFKQPCLHRFDEQPADAFPAESIVDINIG